MIGSSVVITASVTLALVSASPSVLLTGVACFALGLGLGFVAAPALIAAQSSVDWGERGVVTGTNMFARSIGSAVGVAALGALVNNVMHGATATADPALFGVAVTRAFWAIACVAAVTAAVGLLMPKDHPQEATAPVGGGALYADPDHATGQEGLL